MATSYTPATVLVESGRSVASQLTRVYLVQDGTDAATGYPILTLSDTGPATYAFKYDSGTGTVLIDDDPAVAGALKTVLNAAGELILYE